MFLNTVLLFVVLFYVYPLKFLFTLLVYVFSKGALGVANGEASAAPVITDAQLPGLMTIYGCGFAAVYLVFTLMYWNAWRQRDSLDLNQYERFDTRQSIFEHCMMLGIGLGSLFLAAVLRQGSLAGMIYMLIPVLHTIRGTIVGRKRRALAGQAMAAGKG